MSELANRGGEFSLEDIDESLARILEDEHENMLIEKERRQEQIGIEQHQRSILRQRQGMHSEQLIESGIADKITEIIGEEVDIATRIRRSDPVVFEMEMNGIKEGGIVTELCDIGDPDGPTYKHYTTVYVQHGEEPLAYMQVDITNEETALIYDMAQEIRAMAESGQIAPSPDLTEHYNPLLPEIEY